MSEKTPKTAIADSLHRVNVDKHEYDEAAQIFYDRVIAPRLKSHAEGLAKCGKFPNSVHEGSPHDNIGPIVLSLRNDYTGGTPIIFLSTNGQLYVPKNKSEVTVRGIEIREATKLEAIALFPQVLEDIKRIYSDILISCPQMR